MNENLIHYEDLPLSQRFKDKEFNILENNTKFFPQIKSILRGYIPNITIGCLHRLTSQIKACNGYGKKSVVKGIYSLYPDYENYYINHYFAKSLEEFIEKIKRGSAATGKNERSIKAKIARYFGTYKITKQKINYIENKTGFNLSIYKSKIKS